jgi:chromosome segregation ATPase
MAGLIPDTPQWVQRALIRVDNVKNELGQEEVRLERHEQMRMIEEVKKALKAQMQKKNEQLKEVDRAFAVMEERVAANMERIKMLEKEKKEIREKLNDAFNSG